jgi:hypothetical protein
MKLGFQARCLALFLSLFHSDAAFPEGGGAALKENLDLPFDAADGDGVDDPDPEIVEFYGQTFEADAFFYVIDRSMTMQDSGELPIAKSEVIRNIRELSEKVEFGVIFFDRDVRMFPSGGSPAEATPAGKAAAISFVEAMSGGSGTCQQPALAGALQMASRSTAKRKAIIYLSDGGGTCGEGAEAEYLRETIALAAALNWQRVPIHTIGVLDLSPLREKFLKDLAATSGGTFRHITRG